MALARLGASGRQRMFVGDNFTFSNAPALANRSRNEDRRIRVQLPVRLRAVFPIIYLDVVSQSSEHTDATKRVQCDLG
jgi:hypothetical protein